ncbi:MAG: hypothetical protein WCW01_04570 [Gammaproteobacteria bacterium]
MSDYNLDLYEAPLDLQLERSLNSFMENVFGADIEAVVGEDFFLLTRPLVDKSMFRSVDTIGIVVCKEDEYRILVDPILAQRGLAVGFMLGGYREVFDANYATKIFSHQTLLIRYELAWIEGYMEHLRISLTERISEGSPIIQKEVVRRIWADLVERIESLRRLVAGDEYLIVSKLVAEACILLAKLAGGRALLRGQVIEMSWLFGIINEIYIAVGDDL